MNRSLKHIFSFSRSLAYARSLMGEHGSYGKHKGENSGRIPLNEESKREDFRTVEDRVEKAERKRARIRERNLSFISSGGMNQFSKR